MKMSSLNSAVIAAAFALSLGAGAAWGQSAPATTPPEKLQGSTTARNPATAGTPTPPATVVTPTLPAGPSNNAVNTAPANNPGAPVSGANSFTESEARARIESGGFAQVGALKLDSKGVWRGTASKGGKSGNVALDYQGNIVAE